MDAYYVRLARTTLGKAINELERTQEYLVRAGDCRPQIERIEAQMRRLQKQQAELMAFLRDGVAEEQ